MAGFGAERAAVDERALVGGGAVLDRHWFWQVPVDAGEIFKSEFVGAVGSVPRTRFLHLSLRLLARSLGPIVRHSRQLRRAFVANSLPSSWPPIYDAEY